MSSKTKDLQELRARYLMGGAVGSEVPLVLLEGNGSVVKDINGNRYIDCTSQAWSLNVGYCHPRVIQAATEQMRKLTHARTGFDTLPKLRLVERLSKLAPGKLKKITFCLHGSLAVEQAMKEAMINRPGASEFVTLHDGYHGRTLVTMAASWPHPNNRFRAFMEHFTRIPNAYCYRCCFGLEYPECHLMCADQFRILLEKGVDRSSVAALLMEPIQGNGGMICFPKDYFKRIRRICDENGVILIFDEIQTAFGRLGSMFAAELYETLPDVMVFGKSIGGGFPLAGTLSSEDLTPIGPWEDTFTFAHFPVSFAAALAALDVIEHERLPEKARETGEYITKRLKEFEQQYELIGEVRGPGLMIGVELVKNKKTKEPAYKETDEFVKEGLKRGIMFGHSKFFGLGNVIKVKPPLVINEEQADTVLEVFEEVTKSLSD